MNQSQPEWEKYGLSANAFPLYEPVFSVGTVRELLKRADKEARTAEQERVVGIVESKREMEDYDVMVCSKCTSVIRERTSHHSEDGYSPCCGKKLQRKQGKKDTYSCYNQALTDITEAIRNKELTD